MTSTYVESKLIPEIDIETLNEQFSFIYENPTTLTEFLAHLGIGFPLADEIEKLLIQKKELQSKEEILSWLSIIIDDTRKLLLVIEPLLRDNEKLEEYLQSKKISIDGVTSKINNLRNSKRSEKYILAWLALEISKAATHGAYHSREELGTIPQHKSTSAPIAEKDDLTDSVDVNEILKVVLESEILQLSEQYSLNLEVTDVRGYLYAILKKIRGDAVDITQNQDVFLDMVASIDEFCKGEDIGLEKPFESILLSLESVFQSTPHKEVLDIALLQEVALVIGVRLQTILEYKTSLRLRTARFIQEIFNKVETYIELMTQKSKDLKRKYEREKNLQTARIFAEYNILFVTIQDFRKKQELLKELISKYNAKDSNKTGVLEEKIKVVTTIVSDEDKGSSHQKQDAGAESSDVILTVTGANSEDDTGGRLAESTNTEEEGSEKTKRKKKISERISWISLKFVIGTTVLSLMLYTYGDGIYKEYQEEVDTFVESHPLIERTVYHLEQLFSAVENRLIGQQ